jgi:mRNA-degrading endonuclease RelE of RelBE toxin-antitoxin system
MPYKLVTVPTSRRALKRLPQNVKVQLIHELKTLTGNPLAGEQLRPPYTHLRSYHVKLNNVEYRVIYLANNKTQEIFVIYAATRENFYQQLRRLNAKQLLRHL